jgi:PAP2 superfamily
MRVALHPRRVALISFLFFFLLAPIKLLAQSLPNKAENPIPKPSPTPRLEKKFLKNILLDQRDIWTAPFRLDKSDQRWLIPLGTATAVFIATDRRTAGGLTEDENNGDRVGFSRHVSDLGSQYSAAGILGILYITSRVKGDERMRETSLLGTEAVLNGLLVTGALKLVSQRQRPDKDHASGEFFDGGSSFPSGHATTAWALATVIGQEYGKGRPIVRIALYGVATAVSVSRYTGTSHFLSDVIVGSAIGYGIGRYVYRKRHDPSLDTLDGVQSVAAPSKLYPQITPIYVRQAKTYGAALTWNF